MKYDAQPEYPEVVVDNIDKAKLDIRIFLGHHRSLDILAGLEGNEPPTKITVCTFRRLSWNSIAWWDITVGFHVCMLAMGVKCYRWIHRMLSTWIKQLSKIIVACWALRKQNITEQAMKANAAKRQRLVSTFDTEYECDEFDCSPSNLAPRRLLEHHSMATFVVLCFLSRWHASPHQHLGLLYNSYCRKCVKLLYQWLEKDLAQSWFDSFGWPSQKHQFFVDFKY